MFKRVCETWDEQLEGFSYIGQWGEEEFVELGSHDTVTIKDGESLYVHIFDNDIPKLIKALTAAYEHKTGGKLD